MTISETIQETDKKFPPNRILHALNLTHESDTTNHEIAFADPENLYFVNQVLVQNEFYKITFGTPVDTEEGLMTEIEGIFEPVLSPIDRAVTSLILKSAKITHIPKGGIKQITTRTEKIKFNLHANDIATNTPSALQLPAKV